MREPILYIPVSAPTESRRSGLVILFFVFGVAALWVFLKAYNFQQDNAVLSDKLKAAQIQIDTLKAENDQLRSKVENQTTQLNNFQSVITAMGRQIAKSGQEKKQLEEKLALQINASRLNPVAANDNRIAIASTTAIPNFSISNEANPGVDNNIQSTCSGLICGYSQLEKTVVIVLALGVAAALPLVIGMAIWLFWSKRKQYHVILINQENIPSLLNSFDQLRRKTRS